MSKRFESWNKIGLFVTYTTFWITIVVFTEYAENLHGAIPIDSAKLTI